MQIAAKTMYYKSKTILGHKVILDIKKTLSKMKYFSNMSNFMILAAILKICQFGH